MTNTKKKIVAIIGVIMLLASIICLVLVGCFVNTKPNKHIKNNVPDDDSGFVVNEPQTNGILLAKSVLQASDYEKYGVSALAEAAYSIDAQLDPPDAVEQTLNWSLVWTDSNSSWASGKNVNEYVTYTLSNENKTITLSCLQPFASQMTVTAIANSNSNITATCTLDYAQKVTSSSLNFGNLAIN